MRARTAKIGVKMYTLVVLRVTAWDKQGRPSRAVIGHDDTTFDLSDENQSNEFITAYVPADTVKPCAEKALQ